MAIRFADHTPELAREAAGWWRNESILRSIPVAVRDAAATGIASFVVDDDGLLAVVHRGDRITPQAVRVGMAVSPRRFSRPLIQRVVSLAARQHFERDPELEVLLFETHDTKGPLLSAVQALGGRRAGLIHNAARRADRLVPLMLIELTRADFSMGV